MGGPFGGAVGGTLGRTVGVGSTPSLTFTVRFPSDSPSSARAIRSVATVLVSTSPATTSAPPYREMRRVTTGRESIKVRSHPACAPASHAIFLLALVLLAFGLEPAPGLLLGVRHPRRGALRVGTAAQLAEQHVEQNEAEERPRAATAAR